MDNNNIFECTNYKKIKGKKLHTIHFINVTKNNDIFRDKDELVLDKNDIFGNYHKDYLKHKIYNNNYDVLDENTKYKDSSNNHVAIFELNSNDIFNNDKFYHKKHLRHKVYNKNYDIFDREEIEYQDDANDKDHLELDKNVFFDNKEEIKYQDNVDDKDMNKGKEKNSKVPIIIFSFIFIVGIGLMFYPTINNIINNSRHRYVISKYDDKIDSTSNQSIEDMFLRAYEYNKKLNHASIKDVFSTDKVSSDQEYDSLLNVTDDGLMGYLMVPKINIQLPIYHSTREDVLAKGVGHLKGSSLPVGGIGSHAILAAHRGLPTSKLFSDLDQLVVGDKFYLSILGKKLVYKVDNVSVVKPSEVSLLDISSDKDYVTLVTCTPYGVNSHRLLVRGVRIEEREEEIVNELEDKELIYLSNDDKLLIGIVSVLLIVIFVVFVRMLVKKNEK